jgi:hypothetical protein
MYLEFELGYYNVFNFNAFAGQNFDLLNISSNSRSETLML